MAFKEFSKLAKVGLDLNSCQSLLRKLVVKTKVQGAKTSFDFLNKLISSCKIYPRSNPPLYDTLTNAIIELGNSGLTKEEYETAAKILEKFGIQLQRDSNAMEITSEELLDITPARIEEKDGSKMDTTNPNIVSHAIISKFDIDHLRSMYWPDIWYSEFYAKTKQKFGKEMTEISAGNSKDLTRKIEEIIKTNTFKKVYIIIFGFSPCISGTSPFVPGHIIIPVAGQLPEVYNVENIRLIKQLENIETFIILFTLPSTRLQLRNERDLDQLASKFDTVCRIQSKTLFFQCPVTKTDTWDKIIKSSFYEKLEDKSYFSVGNYIYLNNLATPTSESTEETDSEAVAFQEGLTCNIVFGELNNAMKGVIDIFNKRFTRCRNWKYLDDEFRITHKNTIPRDDTELQDIAGNIDLEISKGVKYILIFIFQSCGWESKQNALKAYINIVNTITESGAMKQHGIKKIFMNYNNIGIDDWTYSKEDAGQIERGIKSTKDTYFILSDDNFLLQLSHLLRFQESTKQYCHFLKPTVDNVIKENDSKGENKCFNFAQVVSSPQAEDFIFPRATINIK